MARRRQIIPAPDGSGPAGGRIRRSRNNGRAVGRYKVVGGGGSGRIRLDETWSW